MSYSTLTLPSRCPAVLRCPAGTTASARPSRTACATTWSTRRASSHHRSAPPATTSSQLPSNMSLTLQPSSRPRLSLAASLYQLEIETIHTFVFFSFFTFSLWEKTWPHTCQSVASVIFWLTDFCACLVCHVALLLPSLTLTLLCSALLALFQMCVIRRDMKSVQDRLLAQMVSRVDTFGSSALISAQHWHRLCISVSCTQNNYTFKNFYVRMTFSCLFVLQQEEEILSVKRGLQALFLPWWSFQLY